MEGSSVLLTCVLRKSGYPNSIIRWFSCTKHSCNLLSDNSNHQRTFLIRNVNRETTRNYSCEASNNVGVATKHILLDILYPPKIIYLTSEFKTYVFEKERQNKTLICETEKGNPDSAIIWQFKSVGESKFKNISRCWNSTSSLYLEKINRTMSGTYRCLVENTVGNSFKDVDVNVAYITVEIKKHKKSPGNRITVEIIIKSNPKNYTISWSKNQTPFYCKMPSCSVRKISDRYILHFINRTDEMSREEFELQINHLTENVSRRFDLKITSLDKKNENENENLLQHLIYGMSAFIAVSAVITAACKIATRKQEREIQNQQQQIQVDREQEQENENQIVMEAVEYYSVDDETGERHIKTIYDMAREAGSAAEEDHQVLYEELNFFEPVSFHVHNNMEDVVEYGELMVNDNNEIETVEFTDNSNAEEPAAVGNSYEETVEYANID